MNNFFKIFVLLLCLTAAFFTYADGCYNTDDSQRIKLIYTGSYSGSSDNNVLFHSLNKLKNTKSEFLILDSGGIFDINGINNFENINMFFSGAGYTALAPSLSDVSNETFILKLNELNIPKVLTNAELTDIADSRFCKSMIVKKNGLNFLIMNIVDNYLNSDTSYLKNFEKPEEALKKELKKNFVNYDFLVVSANMPYSKLPQICLAFPEIDVLLWSDGFMELHKEKKIWNDIIVVNSGKLSEYIGALDITMNQSDLEYRLNAENVKYKNSLFKTGI